MGTVHRSGSAQPASGPRGPIATRWRIPAVLTLLGLLVAASVTPMGGMAAQALMARERTADERLLEELLFDHHLVARSDPGAYGHGVMDAEPPLCWADDVAVVARAWSDEMARTGVFEHNPDFPSQTCCWQRIGENIVMGGVGYLGFYTVEEVADRFMQGWMDSDGHRLNLMRGSHAHVALGASIASDGAVYVTAVLRTPTSAAPACSPTYPQLASSDGSTKPDPEPDHQPAPDPVFSDLIGSTHAGAIVAVTGAGIASGYPDGTYRPDRAVTRGQMATFLTNAFGLKTSPPAFADTVGTTHAPAVGAITAAGIANGYPDGTYRPDRPVTRGQMATFLTNALDLDAS